MKTFTQVQSISTVLLSLLLATAGTAAPLAILTDVGGSVQIVRGGKAVAAQSGAKLSAGDRVVSRGGKATIFYLGRAPQKLSAGASAIIGASGAAKDGGVWRGVYAGVSNGFDSRARVAATVRDESLMLWTPVNTKILGQPRFVWTDGTDARQFTISLRERGSKSPLWSATVAAKSVAYPLTAPALKPGKTYEWTVMREGWAATDAGASASASFMLATPAEISAWRDASVAFRSLDSATRRNSAAAFAADQGFSGEALEILAGVGEPDNFATRAAALDETGVQLLRSVTARNGQVALLAKVAAPTAAAAPVTTPDAGLPIDAGFTEVPLAARKSYVDEAGLFSIQLPQTWGAWRQVDGDLTRTDFAPKYAGDLALSVVVAPRKNDAVSLTSRLLETARAGGVAFEITQESATTIKQKSALIPARETRIAWREKRGDAEVQWRGAMTEFAVAGKSYVLGWSAVQKGSTVEFDRTSALLRNLQQSFVVAPDAVGPKSVIIAPVAKEMQDEMRSALAALTAINERSQAREKNDETAVSGKALRERYDAAAPDSLDRADAARLMARQAEDYAWKNWNRSVELAAQPTPPTPPGGWPADGAPQNLIDLARIEANQMWRLADEMRTESYQVELRAMEKQVGATDARIRELRMLTFTLPFASSHAFLLDSWLNVQALRASTMQILAFETRDRDAQLKWAQRELEFRRAQLELTPLSAGDGDTNMRRAELAGALESIGAVLVGRADYAAAEAHYRRALAWRRALPESFAWRGIEGTLRSLGSLALNSGDFTSAREQYTAALREIERVTPLEDADYAKRNNPQLTALRRAGRAQSRAVIWNNLGFIADGLGDYRLARENYQQALKQVADLPDEGADGDMKKWQQARTLNNLGALEAAAGDLDAALKFQDESLVLLRERSDASGLAIWMMNRASLMEQRGDIAGARRAAQDARTRFLQLHVPSRAAFATAFLARMSRLEGDAASALQLARESLQMARTTKDLSLLAQATRGVAVSLAIQPKPDWREFDSLITESLQLAERIASPMQQSATLDARAQGRQARGDLAGAEADYRAAIARQEAVRATTPDAENFADKNADSYERLVRLLLVLKRPEDAFDVLQRARSSKLRENLRLGTLKSPDPALQKLLDRAAALEAKLRTLREQRETALAAPAPDTAAVQNLEGLIASTQSEFFAVSARLKKANPAFDRALTISPIQLKKASTSFPAGTVLVQYALLDEELYIFVVTRQQLKIYQPKVRSNSVLEAARRFRAIMDAAQNDARAGKTLPAPEADAALRESLTQLYAMLIAPIAGELRGQKMLAFVPSGALYYIPLHALARQTPEGLHFLVEDIPVAYLAAGDVLSVVQARDDERFGAGALALGDPTGANLPQARKEARAVAQILPASQSMVGDEAQKAVLLDAKNLNRRVLHLAMHGVLNAAVPDDSYIQLAGTGDTSRLRVGEIVGLDLNRVDLVTLSACQTALGERAHSGGEIASLAQSFSSAGATSVIASLWSVEDDSTRQLMETFYRAFAAGENKAASLQRAQIALSKQPATRHPFFWAPFELLGDWR